MIIKPLNRFTASLSVPGDKSISHRYALLGGAAEGETFVSNYSSSRDCSSTLDCLAQLGVEIARREDGVCLRSRGMEQWIQPEDPLDAGNSGTTIRLLSGLLAGKAFPVTIGGDESLSSRPMKRIIEPLRMMGAEIKAREGGLPPLEIKGGRLRPITYELPVASAQVKSCVLLAGLSAGGRTSVVERVPTRDHTERALPLFGIPVAREGDLISVEGPARLRGIKVKVPGDLSSAVFFLAAALLIEGSRVTIEGVGVNPSRSAFLMLLKEGGADIVEEPSVPEEPEPCRDLDLSFNSRFFAACPGVIAGGMIPNLIDEIPILAVIGVYLEQGLIVRDAAELRKKESDRIKAVVNNMRALGVRIEEYEDGFRIPGGQFIRGGTVESYGDHRIAMAFSIAGLVSRDGVEIRNPECVDISFPEFYRSLEMLRA